MNIFYLDKNPVKAAKYHCDKHVVKMIVESAQMLSTAHHILDEGIEPITDNLYRVTHKNHPSTVWVRESDKNYIWLYELFIALCDEYTHRYGKIHLTDKKFRDILCYLPVNIPEGKEFYEPPQCMPDEYKVPDNVVQAYINYYLGEKSHMLVYTKRNKPYFVKELV